MNVSMRNWGTVNQNVVHIGNITLYFSYETIVAFDTPLTGEVCCENVWSMTTGKMLNKIEPDKKRRVSESEFQARLKEALEPLVIADKNLAPVLDDGRSDY